jgi:hypothetical protein
LFGSELPAGPPWDPCSEVRGTPSLAVRAQELQRPNRDPTTTTAEARTLQKSHERRIWSTLLDYRDWVSYIYVPILVPILILLPYIINNAYQRSHRDNQIAKSLAQGSRDLEQMTRLMDEPVTPWMGERAEELRGDIRPDLSGYLILQDMRIVDLRSWKPEAGTDDPRSFVYGYRRLKVQKKRDVAAYAPFRVSVLAASPATQVRFPPQQLKPKLYSRQVDDPANGEKQFRWEVGADFSKVPAGDSADLIYEHLSPGVFLRAGVGSTTLAFDVEADTAELTRWLLMPQGREYRSFQVIRYEMGKPETAENVKLVTEYLADDFTILAFKLLALKAGHTYEITWFYR